MGFLIGPMKFDMDWRWFSLDLTFSSPYDWALICLVSGPSPLELMTCDVMPYLIAHFECIFYVFHEYPHANG